MGQALARSVAARSIDARSLWQHPGGGAGIDTGVNGWLLALRVLHRLKLLSAKSCKLRSCGKNDVRVCL